MPKPAVVVASSDPCASAGAQILCAGGNVVDAAIAAVFATSAGEPSITSLAGGGMLSYRDSASGRVEVCDFFANAPGLGSRITLSPHERSDDFRGLDVLFPEAGVTQTFHIGRASAAVPGVLPGLLGALERWGSLPLSSIVAPSVMSLREGARVDEYQQKCFTYLEDILGSSALGRRLLFDPSGRLLGQGDTFRNPELADTLEELGASKDIPTARRFVRNRIEASILEAFGEDAGGRVTQSDLDAWKPLFRAPLTLEFRGARIDTNPRPSFGGPSIEHTLRLFEKLRLEETSPDSAERLHRLAIAFRAVSEVRAEDPLIFDRSDASERFSSRVDEIATGADSHSDRPEPRSPGNTTHISVVDRDGNAAAVTVSHGEGNGHEIPGTGIFMNNFLGESDLFPGGLNRYEAGERLSTMMAPTIITHADGAVSALGSGGANRIRTAMAQVINALVVDALPPEEAVEAGRIHVENGILSAETFLIDNADSSLRDARRLAPRFDSFDSASLFFGGVHVAHRTGEGELVGGGDSRRNGIVRLVGQQGEQGEAATGS